MQNIKLFLPLLFLFLSSLIIAYFTIQKFESYQANKLMLVNHTQEVLKQSSLLKNNLQQSEFALEGYLLTYGEDYLNSFSLKSKEVKKNFIKLKDLTSNNESQQENLEAIDLFLKFKNKHSRNILELVRKNSLDSQQERMLIEVGDAYLERIENLMNSFVEEENRLLDMRTNELQTTSKKTILFIKVGVSVFLAIVFIFLYRFKSQNMLLENSNKKIKLAMQAKSDFLASMSHEIRTPMNAILGFVEQLSKNEKDVEKTKKFDVIKNSTKQLLNILNDILDFSKIESRKMDVELSTCKPNEVINNAITIFSEIASKKNITLQYVIDENLSQCVLADKMRLQQVVFNLLSNALKFTLEGGEVKLISKYSNTNKIYFSIEDTGIGISEANIEHIFESFTQEDTSTTRRFGGTGLGLAISSALLKLMGSELNVTSELGKGSKFYFELPIQTCLEEIENIDLQDNIDSQITFNAHALIVEDNKTNQMLMSMVLDEFEITYDIANDGVEAIVEFKNNTYDIILMDENMPNMNGIEATKHIRGIEKKESTTATPIIAVTANALTGDKEKFLSVGMDDYISKPYTEEDVLKILKKYL